MIKQFIFKVFGNYDKENDLLKDAEGRGFLERFNLVMGNDFDNVQYPKIEYLFENVLNPISCFERYIPFLERGHGNDVLFLNSNIYTRRKIQRFLLRLYQIKGTIKGYKHLFCLLGFEAEITETWLDYSFDSPITFDHTERRFDMQCQGCSKYCINLTRINGGTADPSPAEVQAIKNIIRFNEPINAKLDCVTYEDTPIDTGDYSYLDFNQDYY
jgi:hypothetical protein